MSSVPPLRKLQYVLAVANDLHFRKAAERLNISQPSMSRQIREFEAELGFDIFRRDHHLVALTEPGRAFVMAAEQMMGRVQADFKNATDTARAVRARNALDFTVAHSPYVSPNLRQQIRDVQREKFPQIRLRFRMMFGSELLDAVDSGVVQVGIECEPAKRSGLKQVPFRLERLCAVAQWGSSLGTLPSLKLADLSPYPIVSACSNRTHPVLHQWWLERCAAAGFRPAIVDEVTSVQEAFDLVQQGVGIAILPKDVCEGIDAPVHCMLITDLEPLQSAFICRGDNAEFAEELAKRLCASSRNQDGPRNVASLIVPKNSESSLVFPRAYVQGRHDSWKESTAPEKALDSKCK